MLLLNESIKKTDKTFLIMGIMKIKLVSKLTFKRVSTFCVIPKNKYQR